MVGYPKNINSLTLNLNMFIHLHHHTFSKFPCKLLKDYCGFCQNSGTVDWTLRWDTVPSWARVPDPAARWALLPLWARVPDPAFQLDLVKAGATEVRRTKSSKSSVSTESWTKSCSISWITAWARRS